MVVFTDLITVEPVYNGYPRYLRNWLLNTGSQKILTSTLIYCGSLKSDVTDAKRPIISLQQICKCDLFLWWQHFKYKKLTHKMTRGLVSIQGWSLQTGKITKKDKHRTATGWPRSRSPPYTGKTGNKCSLFMSETDRYFEDWPLQIMLAT